MCKSRLDGEGGKGGGGESSPKKKKGENAEW